MIINTISLWPPWAGAILAGLKTIETRQHNRFQCLAGQRIALHNSKKWDNEATAVMAPYLNRLDVEPAVWMNLFKQEAHPAGAVVGTVYVRLFRELKAADEQAALCPIGINRYGLLLEEPQPLKQPYYTRGAMGIWRLEIPDHLLLEA